MITVNIQGWGPGGFLGNDESAKTLYRSELEKRLGNGVTARVNDDCLEISGPVSESGIAAAMKQLASDWSWLSLPHNVATSLVRDAREWGGESRELIAPVDGDDFSSVVFCKIEYVDFGRPQYRVVTIPTRAGLTVGLGTEILFSCPLGDQMVDWLTPRIHYFQNK